MPITADRGGVTANYWYESGIKVDAEVQNGEVKLRLRPDSKGGGTTDVRVNIDPPSFQLLIERMLECDFDHAANAFGRSLIRAKKDRSS
jgi:hypothetical protein